MQILKSKLVIIKKAVRAFSLLELSVIIMIAGIIMAGYISWMVPAMSSYGGKYKETQAKIDKIHEAIENFVMTYGRLPCPALNSQAFGTVNSGSGVAYGNENFDSSGVCNSNIGAVPVTNLNLFSDYQLDSWGRKFTYITSSNLCSNSGCTPLSFSSSSADLSIQALGGGSTYTSDGAYIIIAHGPDGGGAYTQAGTQIAVTNADEIENTDGDTIFRSGSLSSSFQHLVSYKSQTDLNAAVYDPGRSLVSSTVCQNNSTYLAAITKTIASEIRSGYSATEITTNAMDEYSAMGNNLVLTTNYADEAVLEMMWLLQEACYVMHPTIMTGTKACPTGLTYNSENNACVYNNGFWDPSA